MKRETLLWIPTLPFAVVATFCIGRGIVLADRDWLLGGTLAAALFGVVFAMVLSVLPENEGNGGR